MVSLRDRLLGSSVREDEQKEESGGRSLFFSSYQEGNFYHVDIDTIVPNPDQPRQHFDQNALDELAASIERQGVLQPIIIRRDEAGKIYLIAGERRLRAAKQVGLRRIPSILSHGNPSEVALIENLQRENLNPIEEAEALKRVAKEFGYTHEQLGMAIGKARSTITEVLSLNKLPKKVKEECRRDGVLPKRVLVEIARQKKAEDMIWVYEKVKKNQLKAEQVRATKVSKKKSHGALTLSKARVLKSWLGKLKLSSLDDTEKEKLHETFKALQDKIKEILRDPIFSK